MHEKQNRHERAQTRHSILRSVAAMARALRDDYPGALHHVFLRGVDRMPIVRDSLDYQRFVEFLEGAAARTGIECHGWTVMPNHYHLIVGSPDGTLSRGMHWLNSQHARLFNQRHNRVGHLFQGRFGSRVITSDADLLGIVRYLALNPVRAGLVEDPTDWKWSSYGFLQAPHSAPSFLRVAPIMQALAASSDPLRDLDLLVRGDLPSPHRIASPRPSLSEILRVGENETLRAAIELGYAQTAIARELGISQPTVSRRLRLVRQARSELDSQAPAPMLDAMGERQGSDLIVRDDRPERGALVAVLAQGVEAERELAEMHELLRTASVNVVADVVQHRNAPDSRTYIGAGKLKELKEQIELDEIEVVVTEDELTPSQQRTLENELGIRVVDRTGVILDIFASHANSAAGKLQVELAQLEYNLQRMRGMWKHLERLGGGVGTRGPGESQLETDRRLARTRIGLLKRRIRDLQKQRQTMRKHRTRASLPLVALAGYTNVGKSTLLNTLTGSNVSSANRLFETLDPTTRSFDYLGRTYLLTDTVGFIRKLPHGLVAAFASTLEETLAAGLILHVVDASADEEDRNRMRRAVEDVLEEIGAGDIPRLLVLNKIDACAADELRRLRNRFPEGVLVSAANGLGIDDLERAIGEHFAGQFEEVELLLPFSDGGLMEELYSLGAPIVRTDTPDGIRIQAQLPAGLADRFARYRVDSVSA